MTCTFDGIRYASNSNVSEFNSTYMFLIPTNLVPCERKVLICTATGYEKDVVEYATVFGNCKRISLFNCGDIVYFP